MDQDIMTSYKDIVDHYSMGSCIMFQLGFGTKESLFAR